MATHKKSKLKIKTITSGFTQEQLEDIERAEDRTQERPEALDLQDIHVADLAFQWREDRSAAHDHIRDLAASLQAQEEPLEPILVIPVGSRFFVVDGHHRLETYHAVGWARPVPVRVFGGTVREARVAALKANNKSKLPLTKADRYESAWRLTKMEKPGGPYSLSKAETLRLAPSVGEGTVSTMRRLWKQHGEELRDQSWAQVKSRQWEKDRTDDEWSDWTETKAQEVADQIVKAASINLVEKPEITARALEKISNRLPRALVRMWLPLAFEAVQEHGEDLGDGPEI